ncbi:MAG: hypothetical protein ACFHWZ_04515 [Phycisphaerales bacterium]
MPFEQGLVGVPGHPHDCLAECRDIALLVADRRTDTPGPGDTPNDHREGSRDRIAHGVDGVADPAHRATEQIRIDAPTQLTLAIAHLLVIQAEERATQRDRVVEFFGVDECARLRESAPGEVFGVENNLDALARDAEVAPDRVGLRGEHGHVEVVEEFHAAVALTAPNECADDRDHEDHAHAEPERVIQCD